MPHKNNRIVKIFSIILIIFLTCFSIWWFNLRLYLASYHLLKATVAKLQGNWSEMINYHQTAVKYQSDNPYFHQQFALDLYQASINFQNPNKKLELLNLGIENIKKIPESERPIEALIWQTWLWTEKAGLTQQTIDFQSAENVYQKATNFTPGTALIYKTWCKLKIYQQNWPEAITMCNLSISLYPDINHPHLNPEHRRQIIEEMAPIYVSLGDIYFQIQDYKKALDNYQQALHLIIELKNLDSLQLSVQEKIANVYYNQGDVKQTIAIISRCHILSPKNPYWPSILAGLYQEIGDLEKAKFWFNLSIDLQNQSQGLLKLTPNR